MMRKRADTVSSHYSAYDNLTGIAKSVEDGRHRDIIGGMWEELGRLQADYMVAQGLKPDHTFIDVGCGSLRAGVLLADYLDAGRYFGIDISRELLDAGYDREIKSLGLDQKLKRTQLHVTGEFDLSPFGVKFDYGIAQSVFTHMPIFRLRDCLTAIGPHFNSGGSFFVTYFERPDNAADEGAVIHEPGGISTYPDRDPYDNRRGRLLEQCPDGWTLDIIGDWNHPRDQQMAKFTRD